ncbi:hypothetical protein BDV37DRAFT_256330 [Aspergillus pseudonomiae]|uniref:Uncharacterized protein n=1 Tax=Aspergillus pseudonomiae TaxID=1506151 RepID=A0A5N7D398_9EURO|nr:uncharacterized protein BDV37DRAFT_256330 [Aspergillus pseudonomiae]KAE8400892.1 hypothetical protein BDV37DRAFT_256330 [Aspergillus pseudonomiae]
MFKAHFFGGFVSLIFFCYLMFVCVGVGRRGSLVLGGLFVDVCGGQAALLSSSSDLSYLASIERYVGRPGSPYIVKQ